MSSGYNIPLVTSVCDISPDVFSMSRSSTSPQSGTRTSRLRELSTAATM